jgi:hypothetical protein
VHDDVRIVAEGLVSLRSEMKEGMQRLDTRLTHIDGQVARVEGARMIGSAVPALPSRDFARSFGESRCHEADYVTTTRMSNHG